MASQRIIRVFYLFVMLCEAIIVFRYVGGFFPISLYVVVIPIAFFLVVIPLWVLTLFVPGTVLYWLKGYVVYLSSAEPEPPLSYKEIGNGKIEFDLVRMGSRESRICIPCVPSVEEWDEKMPAWAKGRREEIMHRVVEEAKKMSDHINIVFDAQENNW